MIFASLRMLSMFILPNPKFTIPPSATDPIYRIHRASADHGTSYISDAPLPATPSRQRAYSTSRRSKVPEREEAAGRRRNTICCCTCHCPLSPRRLVAADQSEPSHPSGSLREDGSGVYGDTFSPSSRAAGANINRTIQNSASSYHGPSSRRRDRFKPIIPLNLAPFHRPLSVKLSKRRDRTSTQHMDDKLDKRHSGPPTFGPEMKGKRTTTFQTVNFTDFARGLQSQLPQSTPQGNNKDQRLKSFHPQSQSHNAKIFELDLSPIFEDAHVFGNSVPVALPVSISAPLPSKNAQALPKPSSHQAELIDFQSSASALDSSGSSYGLILEEKSYDYGMSPSDSQALLGFQNVTQSSSGGVNVDGVQKKALSIPALVLTFPTPELAKSGAFIDLQHGSQQGYCGGAATPRVKPHGMEPSLSDPIPGVFEAHVDEHGVIVSDNARVIGVSAGNGDVATTLLRFRLRNWSARLSKSGISPSGPGVLARLSRRFFGMDSKLFHKRGSAHLDIPEAGRNANARLGLRQQHGLDNPSNTDPFPSFSSVAMGDEKRSSGSSKSTRASRYRFG